MYVQEPLSTKRKRLSVAGMDGLLLNELSRNKIQSCLQNFWHTCMLSLGCIYKTRYEELSPASSNFISNQTGHWKKQIML